MWFSSEAQKEALAKALSQVQGLYCALMRVLPEHRDGLPRGSV